MIPPAGARRWRSFFSSLLLALVKLETFRDKYAFYRSRGEPHEAAREKAWWHAGGRA